MNDKLEPEFRQRLLKDPDARVRLIVGIQGNLAAHAEDLEQRGLKVYRRLGLISALATGATGRQTLALCSEPWVSWIEEDREIRALRP